MGIYQGLSFVNRLYKKSKVDLPVYTNLNEVKSESGPVYLDMNALFYWKLLFINDNSNYASFLNYCKKYLPKSYILVFDGKRSLEKHETSIKRIQTNNHSIQELDACLDRYLNVSSPRNYKYIPFKEKEQINKLIKKSTLFPKDKIPLLIADLKSFGYDCIQADYEADLFLARKPNSTVISKDSDFLFHYNVDQFAFLKCMYPNDSEQLQVRIYEKADTIRY